MNKFTPMREFDYWYSEYMNDNVKLSFEMDEIIHVEKSDFQKITIFRNKDFGNIMILDSYLQVTEKDEFIYHDMIVHPAMATNPDIKDVLIIGGGDGGTARELSRYPSIEKIHMVEIDEAVVNACKKYMPTMATVLTKEPRLALTIGDGIDFVKKTETSCYDLIIVDSTDPTGPGGSLFTMGFYENCYRILREKGILVNQHEGGFYEEDAVEMVKAHEKIKKIFPIAKVYGFNAPSYSSGYWYFGFASKVLDPIDDFQEQKWNEFKLETKYYNSEIHKGAFALPNYVKNRLKSV